ncbi:protein nucleotidyltransferase YdiU-like [Branchiostoma floridae x Branchiostoma belcheri]
MVKKTVMTLCLLSLFYMARNDPQNESDVDSEQCTNTEQEREHLYTGPDGLENSPQTCSKTLRRKARDVKSEDHLIKSFEEWSFATDQVLLQTFPIDPERRNYVRQVRNAVFSVVEPTPFHTRVKLVAASDEVLQDILDLHPDVIYEEMFQAFVSGNTILYGSIPLSHRYGGHQFASWAGQLGDGRAVMLGEYVNRKGERWELQLKGSGLTPYSRRGDGRAVLRSSVREFLCSDAMYHLGIPTSRAATLIVSDDPVIRDQFYNGQPKKERGAVVLRLAKSWFRIGSLEILAANQETHLLRQLVDFVIKQYFTDIYETLGEGDRYLTFFSDVVSQTAEMIALWQSVGFAHGVCNTDNFSLLSITIDYGPFGFMDSYNPEFVPNTSDDTGMYSYENQPDVGLFNLDKLQEALTPLLTEQQRFQMTKILQLYPDIYKTKYMEILRMKMGLLGEGEDDGMIVAVLFKMMTDTKADFTMTFRQLSELSLHQLDNATVPSHLWAIRTLQPHEYFTRWLQVYAQRLKLQSKDSDEERKARMDAVNPQYILRNWMAESAIRKAEKDDFSEVKLLLKVLQNPFVKQEEAEEQGYGSPPPDWAKELRVSCSS